jgi:putative hydrolase of the HAD superfamily
MNAGSVVFDLDGTLVDHQGASVSAIRAWISKSEVSTETSELERGVFEWQRLEKLHFSRYLTGEISFQDQRRSRILDILTFLGREISESVDDLFDSYLELYEEAWAAFDDAVPTLTALKDLGYQVHVFSNGQRAQQERKLEFTGLGPHIDGLVTSGDLGVSKPDPHAFTAAWHALGADKNRSCYVGDDLYNDARAATTAGIRGVWINRASERHDAIGVVELSSLEEISDRIEFA